MTSVRVGTSGYQYYDPGEEWQAVTHPWSSPTWNSHRDSVPDEHTDDVGYLQPTEFTINAWAQTRRRAVALDAAVVVLQTPPSFDCTDEHASKMRRFVDAIDRDGLTVAWEPRGNWVDHPDRVERLCTELDLIHVVDAMQRDPLDTGAIAYTRLHGLNEYPYDYDYEYSASELATLDRLASNNESVFALFNNYAMYENAADLSAYLDSETDRLSSTE